MSCLAELFCEHGRRFYDSIFPLRGRFYLCAGLIYGERALRVLPRRNPTRLGLTKSLLSPDADVWVYGIVFTLCMSS